MTSSVAPSQIDDRWSACVDGLGNRRERLLARHNLITQMSYYGKEREQYNGADMTRNGRFAEGGRDA